MNTTRPRIALDAMARKAGCRLGTIGDIERLAGIDTNNNAERKALWDQFRHLYRAPSQDLINAVMDHCSKIAIRRIKAGKLSLIRTCHY